MSLMFSVIIPVYCAEDYLKECLDSIIHQSYSDYEVILVDDGSTDGSPSICDDYCKQDSRFRVIHQNNGGVQSARKTGISVANGTYIVSVDADDWISLDYLERMAHIIETDHPDVILCGHYKASGKELNKCPLQYRKGLYGREDIERDILTRLLDDEYGHSFALSLWAKAIRASIQRNYQMLLDEKITLGEDIACMAPCIANANSLYIIDECLYYYRQNPDSITKKLGVYDLDGPEIRGKFLETQLDLSICNLQQQLYRSVTHSVFTVVRSQYNAKGKSVRQINKEINAYLNRPYCSYAIKHSSFKGIKANMMKYSLKFRLLWLIRLFNKHENGVKR